MADEPMLCFDGDAAGRRAAYRAVDLALPHLKPGKSLRFASLPRDMIRTILSARAPRRDRGRLAGARPLADVLWAREVEAGRFDTPERRAGLEARINELATAIGDETVRRYYREDLRQRLRDLQAPAARGPARGPDKDPQRPWRGRGAPPATTPARIAPLSPRLQVSSIVRGSPAPRPTREVLILPSACNYPWLLETDAEHLADLEFHNGDADTLRRVMLDLSAERHHSCESLREALMARDCGPILARIEAAVTHLADWPAREGAAPGDVRQWWYDVFASGSQEPYVK